MPNHIETLMKITRAFFTAAQVAPVLGTDPNLIRWQAHHEPEKLGFPVVVIGTRVKIPRIPFLKHMGIGANESGNQDDIYSVIDGRD